jgi:two-component system, chemotaxis family, sensor kinase CheA
VDDLLEQVWPVFVAETREQAQALAAGVMELESAPSQDAVVRVRRLAHSLKGAAGSFGATDIERAGHAMEDVLVLADGGRALPGVAVEALLRAARAVEESLRDGGRGRIAAFDAVLAALHAAARGTATAGVGGPAAARPEGGAGGAELDALAADLRSLCTSDGAERRGHAARARVAAERLAAHASGARAELAGRLARSLGELEAGAADAPRVIARAAAELVELRASPATPPGPATPAEPGPSRPPVEPAAPRAETTLRVDAARLEAIATDVDQLVVGVSHRERRGRELQRLQGAVRDAIRAVARGVAAARVADEARGRELTDGLERLRALGGELGRHARELTREADRERLSAHGLREALQDLRMVPAHTALTSLRVVVRDLAAQLGKPATLRLVGGDVRLDRRVLDELRAPLLHLVRNALDHGVEPAEARRAAGKPREATVELRVEARGDHVSIAVRDDGAGLSPERLRAAAARRGLVTEAEAARLSDAEAARLAFQPGLSTAVELTAVSGRGVGLDVVAEAVRRLGGAVDVSFERGRGTTFALDVPLTAAGAAGVLVRAAGGLALIPADAVERVVLVGPEDVGTVAGQATLAVEGAHVPLTPLALAAGASAGSASVPRLAVVLAAAGRRVAFGVDEVLGQHAIVVTSLGRRLSGARHLAGAAVLDDGRVVAVLHPAELVRAPAAAGPRAASRPRIIVADDSLATRAAEKALLEIAGYEVLPAADGEEAWALARDPGCALVVTDVQMPRLDGFALTRRLKADPALARVPVVLVTSLDAPEDRAAGLRAGADAYLVKRDIQRGRLLELVRQLLPA